MLSTLAAFFITVASDQTRSMVPLPTPHSTPTPSNTKELPKEMKYVVSQTMTYVYSITKGDFVVQMGYEADFPSFVKKGEESIVTVVKSYTFDYTKINTDREIYVPSLVDVYVPEVTVDPDTKVVVIVVVVPIVCVIAVIVGIVIYKKKSKKGISNEPLISGETTQLSLQTGQTRNDDDWA